MKCAWKELTNLLPVWMRNDVDKLGSNTMQELRLRLGFKPELIRSNGSVFLDRIVQRDDLTFCVNTASRYSPWSAATAGQGYITAAGGHRLGLCGLATVHNGVMTGLKDLTSICLRVAREFIGISGDIGKKHRSVLILGRPGCGKTTFLRDLIRYRSNYTEGSVAVIDEKGELFPQCCSFDAGMRTDVLSGCGKPSGILSVLKNMGPAVIAVDEITAQEDCDALLQAGRCGVDIFATAHAFDKTDLYSRPLYRHIIESGLFTNVIVMRPDKSWYEERICQ